MEYVTELFSALPHSGTYLKSFQFLLYIFYPTHKVGSFCFSFDFSRSLCLSWLRAAIACCNFLRTDGFFVLFSVFPVNSRNAAVITSTSLALKKTKYLGGSTDLSRFRLKSMPYFFATFSKALMLLSVISMLES